MTAKRTSSWNQKLQKSLEEGFSRTDCSAISTVSYRIHVRGFLKHFSRFLRSRKSRSIHLILWSDRVLTFYHQILGLMIAPTVLLVATHICVSKSYTSKFLLLSYYNSTTNQYGSGFEDLYFVAFCVLLLTALRAYTMTNILGPVAVKFGVKDKKIITRFSEQSWLWIWGMLIWSFGLVCSPSSGWSKFSTDRF